MPSHITWQTINFEPYATCSPSRDTQSVHKLFEFNEKTIYNPRAFSTNG